MKSSGCMESSLDKGLIDSARLALGFRNDSANIPQSILREICMKSSGCMESSLDKGLIDSGRLALGFQNVSATCSLRFR